MSKLEAITARIDADTLAMIDRVSAAHGQSREAFAAEAIQRVAESQSDLLAAIQVGIDAAERGELVPHADVMRELDAMIAKHRDRCPN